MDNSRLHVLVEGFLNGQLDLAEQRAFYALLNDPAWREELTSKLMELTGEPDMELVMDASLLPILEQVKQLDKPQRQRRIYAMRAWRWAAAVLLLLSVGTIYWYTTSYQASTVATVATAKIPEPGRTGAILTLADGSKVVLDSMGNGLVAQQSGVHVRMDEGQLSYDQPVGSTGAPVMNSVTTPRGRQFNIVLPDGTKVWLNAASSIQYPVSFSGGSREVAITGEAYFEVAADANKPFKVQYNERGGLVEVLGTAFNINAYPDEPVVKTTLLQGSIRVNNKQILQPGEQAILDAKDILTVTNEIDLPAEVAWKNGLFIMRHTALSSLLRQISRWYDIEVQMEGTMPQRAFGGTIGRNVSLEDVMLALQAYGVQCKLENGKLIVQQP